MKLSIRQIKKLAKLEYEQITQLCSFKEEYNKLSEEETFSSCDFVNSILDIIQDKEPKKGILSSLFESKQEKRYVQILKPYKLLLSKLFKSDDFSKIMTQLTDQESNLYLREELLLELLEVTKKHKQSQVLENMELLESIGFFTILYHPQTEVDGEKNWMSHADNQTYSCQIENAKYLMNYTNLGPYGSR